MRQAADVNPSLSCSIYHVICGHIRPGTVAISPTRGSSSKDTQLDLKVNPPTRHAQLAHVYTTWSSCVHAGNVAKTSCSSDCKFVVYSYLITSIKFSFIR
ncbi:hypothetical protein ElyMa_006073800 [Elysia marginata]|uniref:Uncharacterized protein n=1 Tax=Elysia marginata TaxID=1093978 RepID=A0AAV4GNI6_9GAST|nr:hypothetical protein ElyMa_006073800 [Elysia marginata]